MRWLLLTSLAACTDAPLATLGDDCLRDGDCASGICIEQACVAADEDFDGDGLANGDELARGLDPSTGDTDRDGARDDVEVGHDQDGDGVDDALESAFADSDSDCISDDLDAQDLTFDPSGCSDRPVPFELVFLPPLDVLACGGESVSLGSTFVQVRDDAFTDAWLSTLTASGTVDGDTIGATLDCPGLSGSLSAARVASHYEGSFTFGTQHGIVFVAPALREFGVAFIGIAKSVSGVPLAAARVGVALDPAATTTTRSDGSFVLETAIDPDEHTTTTLTIDASGFMPFASEVPVGFGLITVFTELSPIAR